MHWLSIAFCPKIVRKRPNIEVIISRTFAEGSSYLPNASLNIRRSTFKGKFREPTIN
jgi:hypothetical protein